MTRSPPRVKRSPFGFPPSSGRLPPRRYRPRACASRAELVEPQDIETLPREDRAALLLDARERVGVRHRRRRAAGLALDGRRDQAIDVATDRDANEVEATRRVTDVGPGARSHGGGDRAAIPL